MDELYLCFNVSLSTSQNLDREVTNPKPSKDILLKVKKEVNSHLRHEGLHKNINTKKRDT